MFASGPLAQWPPLRRWALAAVAAVAIAPSIHARGPAQLPEVAFAQLPAEAQSVYALIQSGGPFPYTKDGAVFGNRERLLPQRSRGFYREYTVARPKARDRGPRRIVCGGVTPTQPEACYYTADHYASFRRISP